VEKEPEKSGNFKAVSNGGWEGLLKRKKRRYKY